MSCAQVYLIFLLIISRPWLRWTLPGVDAMITIFCDFCQFLEKKIGLFLKIQCYDKLFSKFNLVLSRKRRFFRKIFRRKYLKNHNIGPWLCTKVHSVRVFSIGIAIHCILCLFVSLASPAKDMKHSFLKYIYLFICMYIYISIYNISSGY
jgi:hypothetical protein